MDTAIQQHREITAFFDDRETADRAIAALGAAGLMQSDIRLVEGQNADLNASPASDKGFFEMLGDFFMPDDDRNTYAEGLRRGGYMVSVMASGEQADSAMDILDLEGSIDMDERAQSWESEGWTGRGASDNTPMPGGAGMSGMGMSDPAFMDGQTRDTGDYGNDAIDRRSPMSGDVHATMSDSAPMRDDGVIEVMAEKLRVGKRDVTSGHVRVRSYVVEEPAQADVTLRSERVEINRTPVDRAVTGSVDAFADRTIEVAETSEEAVVSKVARVVEEISLGKVTDTRTETVTDTVRHTEVEIEDDRNDDRPLR